MTMGIPPLYTHTPVIYMFKLSFNYNLIYAAQPKSATKTPSIINSMPVKRASSETTTSSGNSKTISKNDTVRALDEQKINNLL